MKAVPNNTRDYGQIRVSRRGNLQDLTKQYNVYIDGDVVGQLGMRETGQFEVPAGVHRVWARLAGSGDDAVGDVEVQVESGRTSEVRVTPLLKRISLWRLSTGWASSILGKRLESGIDLVPHVLLAEWPPAQSELRGD
jgi:hypothetical protein